HRVVLQDECVPPPYRIGQDRCSRRDIARQLISLALHLGALGLSQGVDLRIADGYEGIVVGRREALINLAERHNWMAGEASFSYKAVVDRDRPDLPAAVVSEIERCYLGYLTITEHDYGAFSHACCLFHCSRDVGSQ